MTIHVSGNGNHVAGRDLIILSGGSGNGSGGGGGVGSGVEAHLLLERRAALVKQFHHNQTAQWLNPYLLWSVIGMLLGIAYLHAFGLRGISPWGIWILCVVGIALPSMLLTSHRRKLLAENAQIADLVRAIDRKLITL